MEILIFLFAILSTPQDRIICDLWTRTLTQEAFDAACPISSPVGYRVDVYSLDMQLLCAKPAEQLPTIREDCGLNGALDQYRLRIVQPAYTTLLCMVESNRQETPGAEMIAEQCPGVGSSYTVQYAGSRSAQDAAKFACPARSIPSGHGFYEQPFDVSGLATRDELPLLAGELIWNGHVKVTTCAGGSGVDLNRAATPCGYLSAQDAVIAWQNQFDAEIYDAALTYRVPARLLKRMMMIESQFWIFHDRGADGEIGIMQITDNGLDTLLRWDREIDPVYLSRDDTRKAWSRNVTRQLFICHHCSFQEAIDHIKNTMPYYARLLAAFHCRAATLNPAHEGADQWRQTVVDYNGSGTYLLRIER